mmetsp:Transcript_81120/g.158480  ORF Transcript_81120/g.158480 Transcript_81120/m.158480 type:complete len:200 (-) Transcript_81120:293-892(-)
MPRTWPASIWAWQQVGGLPLLLGALADASYGRCWAGSLAGRAHLATPKTPTRWRRKRSMCHCCELERVAAPPTCGSWPVVSARRGTRAGRGALAFPLPSFAPSPHPRSRKRSPTWTSTPPKTRRLRSLLRTCGPLSWHKEEGRDPPEVDSRGHQLHRLHRGSFYFHSCRRRRFVQRVSPGRVPSLAPISERKARRRGLQ